MVSYSLSQIVDDVSNLAENQEFTRAQIFPSVYSYLNTLGLTEHEQDVVSKAKITLPFELISGAAYLRSVTEVPPITHFSSLLRAENMISQAQYTLFCEVWRILKPESLLALLIVYVCLDSAFLCDAMQFYMEHLFQITNCHPIYYKTISSLALASALFNSTDPVKKGRLLRLHLLPEPIYNKFKTMLIGGLSSISSHFSKWNCGSDFSSGYVTYGTYIDINGTYQYNDAYDNDVNDNNDNGNDDDDDDDDDDEEEEEEEEDEGEEPAMAPYKRQTPALFV